MSDSPYSQADLPAPNIAEGPAAPPVAAPPPPSAPPLPAAPKTKRGILHRLFRFAVRAAALLALLVLAGLTALYFTPFSFEWLDRRIKAEAEARAGLRLEFPRALISLSRSDVRIDGLSAADPKTNEPLVALASVEADIDFYSIWRSWRSGVWLVEVPRVSLAGPLALDFEDRDGSIAPGPKLTRLREIIEARVNAAPASAASSASAAPPGSGAPSPPARIGRVDLNGMELNLVRVAAGGAREPEFTLREMNLLAEFGESFSPALVIANGAMEGRGGRTPVNLRLQPIGDGEYRFDLAVPQFDSDLHLPLPPSRRVVTARASSEGVIRREGESLWSVVSSTKFPSLTLMGAGADGEDERLDEASLYATVRWIGPDRRLACEIHEFASKQANLVGSAWLDLTGDRAWRVDMDPLEVREGGLELVEARVFRERYLAPAPPAAPGPPRADPDGVAEPPARVEIRGGVSGQWGRREIKSMDLAFLAEGVSLKFPDMPEPVTRVKLEGKADLERIALSDGFLVLQGVPFKLSGEIHGKVAEARVDSLALSWETAGQVEGISDLIARNGGEAADLAFKGDVMGKGSIRLKTPEAGRWSDALSKSRIEGEISFNQAELTHRRFKQPIRDLRGSVKVKGSRAELVNISGRVEDATFSAAGTISGDGQFWRDPDLDLKLAASAKLEDSARVFAWFDKTPPKDWPAARGAASAEGTVRGKWDDPKAWDFSANVTVRNLVLGMDQFDNKFVAGEMNFPRLEAAIAPASLRIAPTEGSWGAVRAGLSGELTPAGGELIASLTGELTEIKKVIPEALKRFDVGGLAASENHLTLARLDSAASLRRFTDLLPKTDVAPKPAAKAAVKPAPKPTPKTADAPPPAPADPNKSAEWIRRFKEEWSAKVAGSLKLEAAEATMDIFPTRVTDATGVLNYDGLHIWSPEPLAAKLGLNAENTRVGIDIVAHDMDDEAAPPTVIQATVTGGKLDIDEWARAWRKPDPSHLDQGPHPDVRPKPKLVVNVVAAADRFRYKGIDGADVSGTVEFQYYARKQDKLFVRDARARDSSGTVLVSGRMESLKEYHESEWVIHAEDVNAADVVRAYFGIENQGGLTSGRVTGNLRLHREGPKDGDFKGTLGFLVRDSRFVSNAVLGGLGQVLKLEDFFNDVSFSEIQGSVDIDGPRASFTGDKYVRMRNPSLLYPLDLKVQGTLGPENKLDLNLTMQFLPQVSKAPIVGRVWNLINSLAGKLLRYRVGGTMKEPRFDVLPFP